MWVPIVVIVIAVVVIFLTWTKNVKPAERSLNWIVTIVAGIFIVVGIYFLLK